MRAFALVLCAGLALAACGDESRQVSGREAGKIVEEVNRGPAVPVAPQPILETEIAKLRYRSGGCVFSPGSGVHGAMALAMEEAGYMKFKNKIERFAADSGSPLLRDGARVRYVGESHLFRLTLTEPGRGRLIIEDAFARVVFDAEGKVWCDS
ncbi:MAG: hypothetical protein H6R45_87 [Proteobacteria bacterium]|nr:hypothetical protein [Pseudomonadota bacterium]